MDIEAIERRHRQRWATQRTNLSMIPIIEDMGELLAEVRRLRAESTKRDEYVAWLRSELEQTPGYQYHDRPE